jgi:two-component system, sporulation sensor kinase E
MESLVSGAYSSSSDSIVHKGVPLSANLLDVFDTGIITIDKSGYIVDFNTASERFLSLSKEVAVGSTYNILTILAVCIEKNIALGVDSTDLELILLDGSLRCSVDITYVGGSDTYISTLIRLTDITEKYELQQQLIAAERFSSVGKLAAGLAHEIRNPLTSIMGFMQLLSRSVDYSKLGSYLPIMLDELHRVKQLVSDFVVVAQPSESKKKDVILSSFLSDTVTLMESQALLKGVDIEKDYLIPDDFELHMDSKQVKQVLINVIQNSVDAMEDRDGKIVIGCYFIDRECVISITDNGVGMTEVQLASMMTPFYTTKTTGTGLGMSVCQGIITEHGGRIEAHSKVGSGTRLDIYLPY